MRIVLALLVLLATAAGAPAADKPKLGPHAQPILANQTYLRTHAAPDYWAMAAFYTPQATDADCSVAAAAMAINALKGLSRRAEDAILTEAALLDSVGDTAWRRDTANGGSGVTFAEFDRYIRTALPKAGLAGASVTAAQPAKADRAALTALRMALAANEASGRNVMVVFFNQGVLTGDWDGPHASPIGAYDAKRDRVLVMDVDREWYVPYWVPTARLLAAMLKPAPAEMGRLAGDRGGYFLIGR